MRFLLIVCLMSTWAFAVGFTKAANVTGSLVVKPLQGNHTWSYINSKNVPVVFIPIIREPIQIDGKLNEKAWQHAAKLGPLPRLSDGNGGYRGGTTDSTIIKLLSDSEHLYVAAILTDEKMEKLRATIKRHDGPIWTDDCLEMFFDPYGSRSSEAHLAVNPLGTRYDNWTIDAREKDSVANTHWNPNWLAATKRYANRWTIEASIPFSSFPKSVSDVWMANFGREQARNGGLSCWAPTINSFHKGQLPHFGMLIFGHTDVLLRSLHRNTWVLGDNPIEIELENITQHRIHKTLLIRCGKKTLLKKSIALNPGQQKHFKIVVSLKHQDFGKRLTVGIKNDHRQDNIFSLIKIDIPNTPIIKITSKPSLVLKGRPVNVMVTLNVSSKLIGGISPVLEILTPNKKENLKRYQLRQIKTSRFIVELPTLKLPPNHYKVAIKLKNLRLKASTTFDVIPGPFDSNSITVK